VYAGLAALVARLTGRDWRRSDGASLRPARILIDAGWQTETVRLFIRQSEHRDLLLPSKGLGIGPGQIAIAEYHRKPGERIGDGWILGLAGPDRLRLLRFDANLWKSRLAGMLTRPMGTKGGVMLFGRKPVDHELLALQLSSEYPTRTEARGVSLDVWARLPDRDNHLFDCLVGSALAASFEGLSPLVGLGATQAAAPRKRIDITELQQRARAQQGRANESRR
jgi:hypothetical protein